MACTIQLEKLLNACADDAVDDGIRIDTELKPLSGSGDMVSPPSTKEGPTRPTDDGPRPTTTSRLRSS